jgi:hypothetical protein
MKLTTKQKHDEIKRFADLVNQGVMAWIAAGEILVALVDADPEVFDEIIELNPHLNAAVLGRFEAMGRKVLHPQLLLHDSPGYQKLAQMPFSVQERYLDTPIPLVVETTTGTDTLMVTAKSCTLSQARQLFGAGRVRSEGEQRAWLIAKRARHVKPAAVSSPAWVVKNGRVFFTDGAGFTAGELATIITQLTK